MFHIQCTGCQTSLYTEDPAHLSDPDAALVCPPGSNCCAEDHHHGEAAAACPGGHGACPTPDNCPVWLGMQPHVPGTGTRDTSAGPCPGGHCAPGIPDCTVCRPLRIVMLPGSVTMKPAGV